MIPPPFSIMVSRYIMSLGVDIVLIYLCLVRAVVSGVGRSRFPAMDDVVNYRVGDVIAVTALNAEREPVLGALPDENLGTLRHFPLKKEHIHRIPARKTQPELEWLDDRTPVFFHGKRHINSIARIPSDRIFLSLARALASSPSTRGEGNGYRVGDILAIVVIDHAKRPVLGVPVSLAQPNNRTYIPLKPYDVSRIPTRKDSPNLTFIDDLTPVLYYGELLQPAAPNYSQLTPNSRIIRGAAQREPCRLAFRDQQTI